MLRKTVLKNQKLSYAIHVLFIQFVFKSLFWRSAANSIWDLL